MLVLTRKVSEAIRVEVGGVEVEIFVMKMKGGQVRLGVKAPRDVKVDRLDPEGKVETKRRNVQPLHDEESKDCWCCPRLDYTDPATGAQVWIHNYAEDAN